MARVNVDPVALTDPRFAILGTLLGTSRYDALGRMVYLWNHCQETERYCLSDLECSALLNHESAGTYLIKSGLAERKNETTLRIKGTRGRIEWLASRRADGRKGGKKGGRPKKPLGDKKTETPRGSRTETPLTLTLTPEKNKSLIGEIAAKYNSYSVKKTESGCNDTPTDLDDSPDAKARAASYRDEYLAAELHTLEVARLEPIGVYEDSGRFVYKATRQTRERIKTRLREFGGPEIAAAVVIQTRKDP